MNFGISYTSIEIFTFLPNPFSIISYKVWSVMVLYSLIDLIGKINF